MSKDASAPDADGSRADPPDNPDAGDEADNDMDAAVYDDDPAMPHEAGMDVDAPLSDSGSVDRDGETAAGDSSTGPAPQECNDANECDDQNPCTIDECIRNACSYSIDRDACDTGTTCDPREGGCVDTGICGDDSDCQDDDPCTRNETCNQSSGRCDWDILDNDGDGHAAEACGGDDFDDGAAENYPGAVEICDGVDNDRNGSIDDGSDVTSNCLNSSNSPTTCVEGECVLDCPSDAADCDGRFHNGCETDLDDISNCGGCGFTCNTCRENECGPGACAVQSPPIGTDARDFDCLHIGEDCIDHDMGFAGIVTHCTTECAGEDGDACIESCVNELMYNALLRRRTQLTAGCMACALQLSSCQTQCEANSGMSLQECKCDPGCVEAFETCAGQPLLECE